MSQTDTNSQVDALSKYHDYLKDNYVGGCERFFSPTGFLEKFQRSVEVQVSKNRAHTFVKSADEAAEKLIPIVDGVEGVFDLTAEPGTGKTSVLPFRFPTKKVVVALPSPFDAFAAYQMATGKCCLKLKGLQLGSKSANVVYTDSYMAARALLSNYLDYDVLIVDECDSPRGVTKFLAEVKAPGKVVVRMSASHGTTQSGPSRSFRVTDSDEMPDIRADVAAVAEYTKSHHKGRSLLLVPDADTALEVSSYMPGSVVICTKSNLAHIASAVLNQQDSRLYVADDTCARGLNLNLDAVFDSQLVAEYGCVRVITPTEAYQRKGRVGRNRAGWYYSPGLKPVPKLDSEIDTARHNLARGVANIAQLGDARLRFGSQEAMQLMDCAPEPYVELAKKRSSERAVMSSSSSTSPISEHSRGSSTHSRGSSRGVSLDARAPSWLFYYSGSSNRSIPDRKDLPLDNFIVKHKNRPTLVRRRTSSSESGEHDDLRDRSMSYSHRRHHLSSHRAQLPIAEAAPYAVSQYRNEPVRMPLELPLSPPIMDLTQLTYDLDWPALIRDRLKHAGDLPTLVPPANWRHTSVGGVGTDWFRRLDDVATGDTQFDERELEIVCRAWNKLVAQSWVRRTPGLSDASNFDRIEFCVRYFQSYFLLSSAE